MQFQAYSAQFDGFRGRVLGLPAWARTIVFVAAIPGLLLAALSLAALLVSILALLLLALPVYGILRKLTGGFANDQRSPGLVMPSRRVEARIVEPDEM